MDWGSWRSVCWGKYWAYVGVRNRRLEKTALRWVSLFMLLTKHVIMWRRMKWVGQLLVPWTRLRNTESVPCSYNRVWKSEPSKCRLCFRDVADNLLSQNFRYIIISLTLYLLTWRIWWTPNNPNKGQMGFNSAFNGLIKFGNKVCITQLIKDPIFSLNKTHIALWIGNCKIFMMNILC